MAISAIWDDKLHFFLKCDAKGCNHIEYYDYPHASHIDRPCPQCGKNLCTKEDMDAWLKENLSATTR